MDNIDTRDLSRQVSNYELQEIVISSFHIAQGGFTSRYESKCPLNHGPYYGVKIGS